MTIPPVSTAAPLRLPCRFADRHDLIPGSHWCSVTKRYVSRRRCATCMIYKPKAEGEK